MKQTLFRAREARAPIITAICVVVGLMASGSQAKAADVTGTGRFFVMGSATTPG